MSELLVDGLSKGKGVDVGAESLEDQEFLGHWFFCFLVVLDKAIYRGLRGVVLALDS